MTNFVKVGAAVAFVGSLVDMTAYQWYQHEAYSHHRDKLLDELDYLSLVSTERGISEIREVYAIESDNETQYLEHRVLVTPFKFNGQLKSQNERSSLIWYSDGSSYLANGYLHNFATPTFTMSNVELESGGQIGKFELGITAHSVVFDNGDAHLALTRPTLSVNVGKSLEQPGARIALSTERILYQEGDTEFVANAITANGSAFFAPLFFTRQTNNTDRSESDFDGSQLSLKVAVGELLDMSAEISVFDSQNGEVHLEFVGNHQLPLAISSLSDHLLGRFAEARGAGHIKHDLLNNRFHSDLRLENVQGEWTVKQ